MKPKLTLSFLFFGSLFLSACLQFPLPDYEVVEWEEGKNECKDFKYADSTYYLVEQVNDYIVAPVNELTGIYGAAPKGLSIDTLSGEINVTTSETGLRYRVFYTEEGSNDSCFTFVTISGINYKDSVYVLDQMDTFAFPIYNASYSAALPCDDDDFTSDDSYQQKFLDDDGCEFDDGADDDDGDGNADEPPAGSQLIPQGVSLNKKTGRFNLKKTVTNGTFGVVPENGLSKDFELYYRLDDDSEMALNKIDIRMYYFNTLADIPDSLLQEMEDKQDLTYFQPKYAGPDVTMAPIDLLEKTKKTRPPYIVIVGTAVE